MPAPILAVPILATKLHIPQPRPRVVPRPGLVERLNEGLSLGRRLTLISAPAGFGKTTLLSEWVHQKDEGGRMKAEWQEFHPSRAAFTLHPSQVAWLSLDEGDSDPKRFLVYLVAALQTLVPDIGAGVLGALQLPQLPSVESLLTPLLNEIAALPDGFILVLDDYHLIDSKPVDNAMAFLLEHLPSQMHLVIASREDPALSLARLRARGQLTELRAADLRFTPAEAAEFLSRVMGLTLSAEDIAALEARTEGWIAGLQLAALSMQGHPDTASFIQSFTGSHHFVLDYLLEEVLHQQPESVQAFLLRTSILRRLCGPLCDAVLGKDEENSSSFTRSVQPSSFMLEHLERTNLFLIALDNERRWYRYHQLFGDLLRQRLGQSLTPEELAQSHLRASGWYEKNGDKSEAFQHAIAARDFSRAAGLAEMAWGDMNGSFQSAAWLGWVKQLPEESIRERPVLCTQIAWAFMDTGDVHSSESRLRDAERWLDGPSEGMVVVDEAQFRALPARIAFARAYNSQTQGHLSHTVEYAELALKLAPEEDQFLRAQATVILGSTFWASGQLEAADKAMGDWMDSTQKAGNFIFAIASASGKADILMGLGRLREAVETYQQSLQLAAAHSREAQRIIAHHYLGLALLYHEMGQDEAATEHFQKSLELGQQSTLLDWPYRRSLAQARLKESEGDLDAALALLEEAKRLYVRTLIPDTHPVEARKARLHLRLGQLSKAGDWARTQDLSTEAELSYLHEFEHITLARVRIAEYQSSGAERAIPDAINLLGRLLVAAEEANRLGSVIEILIVQALAHRAQGDTSRAFTLLERALTLAGPEGYFRIFVDEGAPLAELLAGMNTSPEGGTLRVKEYIHKLLAAFGKPKDIQPFDSALRQNIGSSQDKPSAISYQPLIDPLSQRELEVLGLIAQGLSNDDISRRLFLAVSTVKGHNLRIFAKLQVQSRTEAVARARELGLL